MANTAQADTGFIAKFTVLKGASRELWITFGVKLLGVMAYKMTVMTLSLWLISDFGYGDVSAGSVVAAWTISMTIVTLLVGSLTDAIGLRRTFFLGVWICAVSYTHLTLPTIYSV